tara:strand:- start:80 stop:235 length:156 start_codon:yes stop_codon:yes gene_type:complete
MFGIDKFAVAMLFLGMGIGNFIPALPEPISILDPFLGLVFLGIGVVFLIMR